MTEQTILYVEKDTDLMRSTFVAVGLAHLLYELQNSGDVRIRDRGSAYEIVGDLSPNEYLAVVTERGRLPSLLPALLKKRTAKELKQIESGEVDEAEILWRYVPEGFPSSLVVDYEEERAKADADRKARKEGGGEGESAKRDPRFPLWAHLLSNFNRGTIMRVGYPLVLHIWHSHQGEFAGALFSMILNAYGNYPNDLIYVQEKWQEEVKPVLDYAGFEQFGWGGNAAVVSNLSLVSPTTAQGSTTSNSVRMVNTDIPNTFWLEFYLSLAGYMEIGIPYRSDNDALVYYPLPRDIRFSRLSSLMSDYRSSGITRELYDYSGVMPRAKVDVLCQVTFYLEMLSHYHHNTPDRRRVDAIDGLVGYYYKNLTAHIPFDEITFALPPWLPLELDQEKYLEAKEILETHRRILRALRGDYSEELAILSAYRRFATLGDADDWVEFCVLYGIHRFNKMVDQGWLPWIELSILEKTLMNQDRKDYRPVLETEEFQHIAAAIRACTVTLRYWKDVKKKQTAFKVRHGLGDDLRRNAHDSDRFIAALSDFVADYQRESSAVQANTGETRAFITDGDLYEVIGLIPLYGSRVVANLLVAAGYASDYDRNRAEAE